MALRLWECSVLLKLNIQVEQFRSLECTSRYTDELSIHYHPLLSTFISHCLVAALLLFCIEIIVASSKFNFTQFDSAQI